MEIMVLILGIWLLQEMTAILCAGRKGNGKGWRKIGISPELMISLRD